MFDYITDNAACFGDAPLPKGGSVINFGHYRVYVAVIPSKYPDVVLPCPDSLSDDSDSSEESCIFVEDLTTATSPTASGTERHVAKRRPFHRPGLP